MNDWISVEERLPEKTDRYGLASDRVLVAYGVNDKQIKFGKLRINEWITPNGIPFSRQELITHWMPLPEPPKEGSFKAEDDDFYWALWIHSPCHWCTAHTCDLIGVFCCNEIEQDREGRK